MQISDISMDNCNMGEAIIVTDCSTSSPILLSNLQISNSQGSNDSGIISVPSPCNLILQDSRFLNNAGRVLSLRGGAMATVQRCTFRGNREQGSGGAIKLKDGAELQATNCSFISNSARGGGALHAEVGDPAHKTTFVALSGKSGESKKNTIAEFRHH